MILFLDFDGVTHAEPCFQENVFCRLPLIESILRERELRDIQIVISSSWREHHSLDDMREFFSQDIQGRVVGVTPDIWDPALPQAFVREHECLKWLAENRPTGERWLAIDDRPLWFQANCQNLFLTDTMQGFQPKQMGSLRDMLWERL